jgi:hypothetical protein
VPVPPLRWLSPTRKVDGLLFTVYKLTALVACLSRLCGGFHQQGKVEDYLNSMKKHPIHFTYSALVVCMSRLCGGFHQQEKVADELNPCKWERV